MSDSEVLSFKFDETVAKGALLEYLNAKNNSEADVEENLNSLVSIIRPYVVAVASQYADSVEREDFAHEVLLHIISRISTHYDTARPLKAWLATVTQRKIISLVRHENLRSHDELNDTSTVEIGEGEELVDGLARLLGDYLVFRFSSIPPKTLKSLSSDVLYLISSRSSLRSSTSHLSAEYGIGHAQAAVIYSSSIVFLRLCGIDELSHATKRDEFTMIPELTMLVGWENANKISRVFKGLSLSFRG